MKELPGKKGLQIGEMLEVRNHTDKELRVQLHYSELRISLAPCKEPVIVTISPGRKKSRPNGTADLNATGIPPLPPG